MKLLKTKSVITLLFSLIYFMELGYALPSFNSRTNVLKVPVVDITFKDGHKDLYTAEFERINSESLSFRLLNVSLLTNDVGLDSSLALFDEQTSLLNIPFVSVSSGADSSLYFAEFKLNTDSTMDLVKATQLTGANNLSSPELVYLRVPRYQGAYDITLADGSSFTLTKADIWDALPEVSRKTGGFNAHGQLVHRASDGTESIIYDCSNLPCSPTDPSISPDGTKILFSVVTAKSIGYAWVNRVTLPNELLGENESASLHIYDLKTGELTHLTHNLGDRDISPIWLPDGNIMFASDRAGTIRPWLHESGNPPFEDLKQFQLYIADINGENVRNVTPHEVSGATGSFLLNNGRVAYSSLWLSHNLPYISTNGGINWFGTLNNMWVAMDMDHEGGDTTALLGAHKHNLQTSTGRTKTMKALHFFGQRTNNDICSANYYRGNNLALGDVFCWPQQPKGIEGELPTFLPKGIYNVADWSKSNDEGSFTYASLQIGDKSNRHIGKIGFPEGAPDGQLIISAGFGRCSQVAIEANGAEGLGDQPGCDIGLYKTTTIPSKHPDDLELIVDSPDWHEFGARVIQPRNIPIPPTTKTNDETCQLVSTDAGSAETHPHAPYEFNHNYFNAANHGGEIDGLSHSELAGIRFYEVIPNIGTRPDFKNSIGNKVKFIADVPLLADKSFKVQLPCNTPYLMAGIDSQSRIIKRDQIPQSLRTGEKRVCGGCHLHNRAGRPYEQSMAFNATPFKALTSTPVPSYEADIKPILEKRCTSCHATDLPLFNYNNLVLDYLQLHVPADKKLQVMDNPSNENRKYGLTRPQWSKYVNTMYARESLLYWKAGNKRADGRTDATYPNDIDFGADHPTDVTPDELRKIAAWLDSGANRN